MGEGACTHSVMSRHAMRNFLEGEIIPKFCLLACFCTVLHGLSEVAQNRGKPQFPQGYLSVCLRCRVPLVIELGRNTLVG